MDMTTCSLTYCIPPNEFGKSFSTDRRIYSSELTVLRVGIFIHKTRTKLRNTVLKHRKNILIMV